MIEYFYKEKDQLLHTKNKEDVKGVLIWVDLVDPTKEEENFIEKTFNIELFTDHESKEIESSSKFVESDNELGANINFMVQDGNSHHYHPVSFILTNGILFTERGQEFITFKETYRKLFAYKPENGNDVFIYILETKIDHLADYVEEITTNIARLKNELLNTNTFDKSNFLKVADLQSKSMAVRENIVEFQRTVSAWMRSKLFPKNETRDVTIMQHDLDSLMEHIQFNFGRLESLQDTYKSLIDLEQNRIMKFFTIISVIFLPPTFIAGLYGMNFQNMPETGQPWGYYYALLLMLFSVVISLLIFRWQKWI